MSTEICSKCGATKHSMTGPFGAYCLHETGGRECFENRIAALTAEVARLTQELAEEREAKAEYERLAKAEYCSANMLADSLRDGNQSPRVVAAVEDFDDREWDIIHSRPMPDWLIALRDAAVDEVTPKQENDHDA